MNPNDIKAIFESRFGDSAAAIHYAAPGRINLIGEHTDYNGGFVFPGAVTQGIHALILPTEGRTMRLYAADLDTYCEQDLNDNDGPKNNEFRYIFGVAREMMDKGVAVKGFDAVFYGDVPLGAGMSSSAALESCFAFSFNDLFADNSIDKMTLAKIGQATEHKYIGVKCGIMDQFASVHGKKNCLMRLDCRSGEYEYFPWNPEGYRLVLVNSCVKHELVGSPYNDRRNSCERVAAEIGKNKPGVETLRDCSWDDLERVRTSISEEDYRRARYVLGEVDRVMAVCDALKRGDYETVGKQMYATHEGLSKDYEVSCEEIDFLNDIAKQCAVTGSRIMGGGFGGCTINLVADNRYNDFVATVQREYKAKFGVDCKIIDVEIGDGARRVSGEN